MGSIVEVAFQPKTWCDKAIVRRWIEEDQNNIFHNLPNSGSSGKFRFADVHGNHQISDVKQWFHKSTTILINNLGGTTSKVQPLGININKPFKSYVRELFEQHLEANLESYIDEISQQRKDVS